MPWLLDKYGYDLAHYENKQPVFNPNATLNNRPQGFLVIIVKLQRPKFNE